MSVPRLQQLCRCFVSELVVQDGSPCLATDIAVAQLLWALDQGAWGEESMAVLERVALKFPHRLMPRMVQALLPVNATVLSLKKCPLLTGACINTIVERCPHLESLDLGENPDLDYSEVHLFQGSQTDTVHGSLLHVCLEDCHVSDQVVHALLRNVPSLHALNIARCHITDKVFLLNESKQLAREGGFQHSSLKSGYDCQLQRVDVTGCNRFSSTGVRHLCTLCGPTLRAINMSWTKVDCTSLMYLCGLGLPAVVQFYLSLEEPESDSSRAKRGAAGDKGVTNQREALMETLAKFEQIASQIREENEQPALFQSREAVADASSAGTVNSSAVTDCAGAGLKSSIITAAHCSVFSKDLGDAPNPTGALKNGSDDSLLSHLHTELLCGGASALNHTKPSCPLHTNSDLIASENAMSRAEGFQSDSKTGSCISDDSLQNMIVTDSEPLSNDSNNNLQTNSGCSESSMCNKYTSDPITISHQHPESYTEHVVESTHAHGTDPITISHQHPESNAEHVVESTHARSTDPITISHKQPESYTEHVVESAHAHSTDPITISHKQPESYMEHVVESTHAHCTARFFSPNIEELSISGTIFSDAPASHRCLRQFLLANSEFTHLHLTGGLHGESVTDEVLAQLTETSTALTDVSVEGCVHLTTAGVAGLAACKKLKKLDLTGVSFVEDAGLVHLAKSLGLTRLLIAETRIENGGLVSLAAQPSCPQLQELDLSWCEELEGDQGLNAVASSCHGLQRLMLRECPLSTRTIELIAANCQQLTALSLPCCDFSVMRDDSVVLLSQNLPLLETVDFSWNSNLTDVSVHALLRNCHRLTTAHLNGLKRVTAAPFAGIIAVPEELSEFIAAKQKEWDSTSTFYLALSDLPCLPRRSTLYASELAHLQLQYCDYVEDQVLNTVVAITLGSIQITDYYGSEVSATEGSVERFIKDLLLNTSHVL